MEEPQEAPKVLSVFEFEEEPRRRRQVSTWTRLRRSPGAMIGVVLIVLLLLVALTADLIASQGIDDQDLRKGLFPPSREFPLGTDEFGRDMLSRIIHGSRVSLQVGIIAMVLSAVVGVFLGLIAGYFGGPIDHIVQGMVDISWAFPTVLFAIFLVAVLGPGLTSVMIAVGLGYWGGYARVVRGQVLSLREWEYITAAHAIGASDLRIMVRHILPNVLAPVIVMSTMMMADAILIEATLSFLGMGAQPPVPSWGSILSSGRSYLRLAPWVTLFPGIAIMLTVLGFNLLGDGLRDALDPRLRNV
ncbi:MAG: ABC transporter permease subunit [Anaerolineae bacterium]|nr:ABC transporter permease subunit [Anaerolineae bacterium]NIN93498.1 ABC transporter permease subunit [Anaerolineae bacterium]NIQ76572.1 ABC transporter permease subunit [Anaerolineae bacterium]